MRHQPSDAHADHRDEIDALIAGHHDEQDEALAAWERRQAIDAL